MKISNFNTIELKRNTIANRGIIALSNLKKGLIKKGSVKDLYQDIESIPRRLYVR